MCTTDIKFKSYLTNTREAFIPEIQKAVDNANNEAAKAGFTNLNELDISYSISLVDGNWCAILNLIPYKLDWSKNLPETFIGWSNG